MMIRRSIIGYLAVFCFLFAAVFSASAQGVFKGKVSDSATGQALPYVNIGVVGKNIGTVSGGDGGFSIEIFGINKTDTLKFSMIGYQSLAMTVQDFTKKYGLTPGVSMKEEVLQMKEVVVRDRDLKDKTFGNNPDGQDIGSGFEANQLGNEIAVLMKVKKGHPAYLESFEAIIRENKHGKIKFRLNVYDSENDLSGKSLLNRNVVLETDVKQGKIIIDLIPYNLAPEDDFFVSLEWIEDLEKNGCHVRSSGSTEIG